MRMDCEESATTKIMSLAPPINRVLPRSPLETVADSWMLYRFTVDQYQKMIELGILPERMNPVRAGREVSNGRGKSAAIVLPPGSGGAAEILRQGLNHPRRGGIEPYRGDRPACQGRHAQGQ